ncbi:MAG: O-antigen ligase family protein [Pseudomonadota bacterium]
MAGPGTFESTVNRYPVSKDGHGELGTFEQEPAGGVPLIVRVLFALTCLQLAFLTPNITLIPHERSNLFSALLCAVTLGYALYRRPRCSFPGSRTEIVISFTLASLVILSGLSSRTPFSSTLRGLTIVASGLGGFWCARLILESVADKELFRNFCLGILTALLGVCFWGYFTFGGVFQWVELNPHPLATKIFLLCFAPLSLVLGRGSWAAIPAWALMFGSCVVFYLGGLRSGLFILVILAAVAAGFGLIRWKSLLVFLIPVIVAAIHFCHQLPPSHRGLEYEPAYYRVESYPFSLHIALKHPWLGIGPTAPREEYLSDYDVKYPYVGKEDFAASVKKIRTSENIFLTFMSELGFPFVLLYSASILVLVWRLIELTRAGGPPVPWHPAALFMPIAAALIHLNVYDGLMNPQVSWFFHILLGLVPMGKNHERKGNGAAAEH